MEINEFQESEAGQAAFFAIIKNNNEFTSVKKMAEMAKERGLLKNCKRNMSGSILTHLWHEQGKRKNCLEKEPGKSSFRFNQSFWDKINSSKPEIENLSPLFSGQIKQLNIPKVNDETKINHKDLETKIINNSNYKDCTFEKPKSKDAAFDLLAKREAQNELIEVKTDSDDLGAIDTAYGQLHRYVGKLGNINVGKIILPNRPSQNVIDGFISQRSAKLDKISLCWFDGLLLITMDIT